MRKPQLNRGVLFNHLPEIMMFTSKSFSSESDYILNVSRIIKDDPNIGADEQIFRKIREGRLSDNELIHYLFGESSETPEKLNIHTNSINNNSLGGWYILNSLLNGFKQSCEDTDLLSYIDYLLGLCEVDKKYIEITSKNTTTDYSYLNTFTEQWLALPCVNFDSGDKKESAQFIIAVVLHWAALFEHFLYLDWPELKDDTVTDSPPSILARYTPQISDKKKLLSSVEKFLLEFKKKWARTKYSEADIKWTTLYRDIAKAKKVYSLENQVDPDIESIKKTFLRWRIGGLTIDSFKKNIAVLDTPYDANNFDSSLLVILFVNAFDTIQKELVSAGIAPEFIVEQFKRYPDYRRVVTNRYISYCQTGAIEPILS